MFQVNCYLAWKMEENPYITDFILASGDNFSGFFSYSTQNTLQIIVLLETSQKYQKNSNLINNDKIVVKYLG